MLILFLCKYLKKPNWNERDEKEKQEHGNTKTYNSVKSVLFSNALAFTDVIPLLFKSILVSATPSHVISVLFTKSTPSKMQALTVVIVVVVVVVVLSVQLKLDGASSISPKEALFEQ